MKRTQTEPENGMGDVRSHRMIPITTSYARVCVLHSLQCIEKKIVLYDDVTP